MIMPISQMWAPLCSHFSIWNIHDEEFSKSIGLVPIFIQVHLDDLKEKGKIQGISGSLVLKHPIIWTAGQHSEVVIPNVICQIMACGFKLPLQFFPNLPTSSVWLGVLFSSSLVWDWLVWFEFWIDKVCAFVSLSWLVLGFTTSWFCTCWCIVSCVLCQR